MMELTVKNCNGNIVDYTFESGVNFIYKLDTTGYENEIPMLDDEIVNVKIDNEEVENSILQIVNDLYELLCEVNEY